MKNAIFLTLLSMGNLFAQTVDYNTVILPAGIENIGISEKLVRLAWQNYPANEVAQREIVKAKQNVAVANARWLNIVSLSFNMNEFNINPEANPSNNNFYPRYNVGASIPLGIFMETPNNVKTAKEDYEISLLNLNQQKLALRAIVLTRYQNYVQAKALLDIQLVSIENEENSFSLVEQKFINDEVTLDEYNASFVRLNEEKVKKINLESSFILTKIGVEELIGIPLESVE